MLDRAKRRPDRLQATDYTLQTMQNADFFLILVFALMSDLQFGSSHKLLFNYTLECYLFMNIYAQAIQARHVTWY